MALRDAPHDVQTQTGSCAVPGARSEALKQRFALFDRYTETVVFDDDRYSAARVGHLGVDSAAVLGVRDRVGDEVDDESSEFAFVTQDERCLASVACGDSQVFRAPHRS